MNAARCSWAAGTCLAAAAGLVLLLGCGVASAGSITGTVTAGGSPAAYGNVDVYDLSEDWVEYGTTDASGIYTIGGLPAGTYKVHFSGYGDYLGEWYDGASSFATATPVPVTAGGTTGGIDASLTPGGSITGTVTAGGTPVQDADIQVYDLDHAWVGYAYSDESGAYTVGGLPAGTYKVWFNDAWGPYLEQWYDGASSFEAATAVSVAAGQMRSGINAFLVRGGEITGTVTAGGIPLPYVDVLVYDFDYHQVGNAYSDESGLYSVGRLPTGTYKVRFNTGSGPYLDQWYDGASSFATATGVHVRIGETTGGIDASLQEGGKIAGTVTAGGTPAQGVVVAVYSLSYAWIAAESTDESGSYTVGGLGAGSYKVSFTMGSGGYFTQWYDSASSFETATEVPVRLNETTGGVDAALVRGGEITGTVTAGGIPLPDVGIEVYDLDYSPVGYASSGVSGAYTVGGLPTGTYKVRFYDPTDAYFAQWYNSADTFAAATEVPVTADMTTSGIDASLVRGGEIAGTVTFDGSPIQGAGIEVYDLNYIAVAYASTDENGAYAAGGLTTGAYKVRFHDDSRTYLDQWYASASSFVTATAVPVTVSETTTGINASLVRGGEITGTVTAGGTPVPYVEIRVYDLGRDQVGNAATDADGTYTVGGLQSGTYTVRFSDDSGTYLEQWHDGASSFASATGVSVTAGATTAGIDASLIRGGTITGTVTAGGVPIPGVYAAVYDLGNRMLRYASTSGGGVYTINGLRTGRYKLRFSDPSGTYVEGWHVGASSFENAREVAVTAGATTSGVNGALVRGGEITGTVTAGGLPASNVNVAVFDAGYEQVASVNTGANGVYTVGALPTGTYKVRYVDYSEAHLVQWYSGAPSFDDATDVSVTVGRTTGGIDAALMAGGRITGSVAAAGNPVAHAEVRVYDPNDRSVGSASANADGAYEVAGLPGGTYKVHFVDSEGALLPQWYDGASLFRTAAPVPLVAGATRSGIDAALIPGGTISGTVSAGGHPAPDIDVDVYSPVGDWVGSARTDGQGAFTLRGLATGTYRVRFQDFSGAYLGQWYDGAASFQTATKVSVTAGEATGGVDASLALGGRITGTVTADGNPVSDVDADVYDPSGQWVASARTDGTGTYAVGGLEPGTYRVRFLSSSRGYLEMWYEGGLSFETATPVPVAASGTASGIDASLVPGGRISGTVTSGGGPVRWAWISVYDLSDRRAGSGSTDESGVYVVDGLRTGTYKVQFQDTLDRYLPQWYDGASSFAEATPISVTAGETRGGIDAILALGARIMGTVSVGGVPVEEVSVSVHDLGGRELGQAETDEGGVYVIGGLPAGGYKVRFHDPTDALLPQWYRGASSFGTATAVAVAAGETRSGIDAALVLGGSIAGRVAGTAGFLPEARIEVYDSGRTPIGGAYADRNGAYSVNGLPSGTYKVLFTDDSDTFLPQWYRRAPSFGAATGVPVTAGRTTRRIDAVLALGGRITGTVTAAGFPVSGAAVDVYDPGQRSIRRAHTDENGYYAVGSLPTGTYKLLFSRYGGHVELRQWYHGAFSFESAIGVSVTAGETRSGIDESFLLSLPTDIALSNGSVQENRPVGTEVGRLRTTGGDAGGGFTYALVRGAGDDDNGLFAVDGAVLRTAVLFDYEAGHTFGIRVRSSDAQGASLEEPFTITVTNVNEAPVADAGGPYTALPWRGVTLSGSGSHDPDTGDAIAAFEWDLDGDGRFGDATGVSVALSREQVGSLICGGACISGHRYTVGLRVADAGGLEGTDSAAVTVADESRPYALAVALPNPAGCPQTMTLDGAASTHGDPARSIATYEWDFDYRGTFVPDATGAAVTHTYGDSGAHTAALRVTDNGVTPLSDLATVPVAVGGAAPVASSGGPYAISEGQGLVLTAQASSSPDVGCGTTLTGFDWDLDGDDDYTDARGARIALAWEDVVTRICGGGCALDSPYRVGALVTDRLGVTSAAETTLTISALSVPVRLTAPNGGEFLGTGAPRTVRWLGAGIDQVKVYLRASASAPWVLLFEAPALDGSYEWTPDPVRHKVTKHTYRMRIDGFAAGTKVGSDQSDAPFGIGALDVLMPDGGEELIPGDAVAIGWDSYETAAPVARTVLKYTLDGGASWRTAATLPGNPGSGTWTVPQLARRAQRSSVRVLFYNGFNRLIGQDQSEKWFTILGKVEMTAPENGDRVYGGTSRSVSWVTTTTKPVASVLLRYSLNGGSTWRNLPAIRGNPGIFYWDAPAAARVQRRCRLQVILRNARGRTVASDSGEGWFTLLPRP